jgi:hypothetical protein
MAASSRRDLALVEEGLGLGEEIRLRPHTVVSPKASVSGPPRFRLPPPWGPVTRTGRSSKTDQSGSAEQEIAGNTPSLTR